MEILSLIDLTVIIQLLLFVFLLACSAFFSGSEVALFSLNPMQLDQMAREKHPQMQTILDLLKDPRALITTILIGNELVNVAASNISATLLITLMGSEENWWVNILVMLPILLLFGEITPKTLAVRNSIFFAGLVSQPLTVFRQSITPLRRVVGWISNYFITLAIGEQKEKRATVTEEMVRTLAEQASMDGVIDDTERTYIDNIFNFGNIRVRDVMIPRAKIFFLTRNTPAHEVLKAFKQTGYTRIPVYEGHRDDVVGILHVRDMLAMSVDGDKKNTNPMTLLRKPYFVAANRLASSLFQSFMEKNHSLAMVVDEFGGLVGMVTMHNLMEIIFGPLHGKLVPQSALLPSHAMVNGHYSLPGVMPIEEFVRLTGCTLEANDAETIGGLVLDTLGELPEKGSRVSIMGWEFTVLEMDNNRIASLRVRQSDPTAPPSTTVNLNAQPKMIVSTRDPEQEKAMSVIEGEVVTVSVQSTQSGKQEG